MLMPLLGSQVPVFLFNDDWRASKAILRTRDFNKETGDARHEDDSAALIVYVFSPFKNSFSLLLRIEAYVHLLPLLPSKRSQQIKDAAHFHISPPKMPNIEVFPFHSHI